MKTNSPSLTMASCGLGCLRHWVALSICVLTSVVFAQTVPERPVPIVVPADREIAPNEILPSMAAAALLIKANPQKYQVRVYDLIKGDVYCDIQNVVSDKATGWIQIHFNYRGRTSVNLAPVSAGSIAGAGSYSINLPLLGITDVKVNLTFTQDGTARGEWRNMGYGGAFDIIKK